MSINKPFSPSGSGDLMLAIVAGLLYCQTAYY